jgi:hypothetical protein
MVRVYAAGYAHLTKDAWHTIFEFIKQHYQQDSTISSVTTSRTPTRKPPRLHIEDDDEVQEVPPPSKVIELIDLTSEDAAADSNANIGNLPVLATTRTRGRPRLHQVKTRAEKSGTERDDTKRK